MVPGVRHLCQPKLVARSGHALILKETIKDVKKT